MKRAICEALNGLQFLTTVSWGDAPATVTVQGTTVYVSVSGKATQTIQATTSLTIKGGSQDDVINARFSNLPVTIIGGAGRDRIYGSIYDDDLRGGDGNDFVFGDYGNDLIQGGNHRDTLLGGYGSDNIYSNNAQRNSDPERDEMYANDYSGTSDGAYDVLVGGNEDLFLADTYDRVIR